MTVDVQFIIPKVDDYCNLRKVCGLSEKSRSAAQQGLKGACFTVTLYDVDQLIGLGRVIGDGGTAFQIIDIAVHPDYQGQGYGKAVMTHIMNYIDSVRLPGTYVSLIADYPADQLYKQFGFKSTEPYSGGMFLHFPVTS
ncbi:GNAT family acetyltransferase [Staphylococcus schleiferi]|uniref:GNAT family N-acetyltransferase n=1 Tax=Staphylococcus coagulans TaxID=74706 RepID=UPI00067A2C5A|nr:GNAT family N-acetyltransferase [Staphylococcus coagulans]AKS68494.1 GNAT family acetyltransferase [Staphylococcus schleiferi]AKS70723.1 GNAT family acetyltransferase [Staphylococcus schleiferi]AKS72891.1 GNAT family acetyltransferase [Staphylococcus schleiferi]MBA8764914.1 GNAT family N-acetyltransferase [Staphylococcus coagulans]MBT2810373.1 GNAT family N-acetyltransferase [Staphylococcus coagulans]